jgi:hypothetical protein
MTARELRRQRLEHAAERLGELEAALTDTQEALQRQLAENSVLTNRLAEKSTLLEATQAKQQERRTYLDVIDQAVNN